MPVVERRVDVKSGKLFAAFDVVDRRSERESRSRLREPSMGIRATGSGSDTCLAPSPGARGSSDARWVGSEAELAAILCDPAPDWFRLESDGRATLVKTGKGRRTWRVRAADVDVYAKVFEPAGVFDRWKWRILGSPAEREWRAAREAAGRGVPVVRVIALGRENAREGRAVLITAAADAARALLEVWRSDIVSPRGSERRRRGRLVLSAVARLVAAGDAAGFQHRDGHPSNILVRLAGDSAEAMYVDLLGARFSRRPVGLRRRIVALARLDHSMRRVATRTERLRFLIAYEAARVGAANSDGPAVPVDPANLVGSAVRTFLRAAQTRAMVSLIAREELRHARRLARQRDRRIRRDGPYFATLDLGDGWRATVVLKLGRRQVFPEPDAPDRTPEWWRSFFPALLRDGVESPSSVAPPSEFGGIRVERFHANGWVERLRWAIRGSPARRTFERFHRTRHRDIPAPLALAFAERRRSGMADAAFVVTSPL